MSGEPPASAAAAAAAEAGAANVVVGGEGDGDGEQRMQYANKLELMLTLIGYAVGLGNVWRFPYLTYTYGGGAFLLPYIVSLLLLGLPLFAMELGLGQMLRQGTLGVWQKLGMERLRGVGAAATLATFFSSLYYVVILAWTIYYLARTLAFSFSGTLPWGDQVEGFACPESVLYPSRAVANLSTIIDPSTGLFNEAHRHDFWCPATGLPTLTSDAPADYQRLLVRTPRCPATAALQFWEKEALQQTSGLDDLGGFQPGMLLSYTLAWILVYLCVCKGIASSGKVVYLTATLPYVALVAFFFRAVTLPNAGAGVEFFLMPSFGHLLDAEVWIRAATQIFYSLGVGFGSLIAFASYGQKDSDYTMDAVKVSFINCGTSIFAGFVVFPILGFLAQELAQVNPCIHSDDLTSLSHVGLSGTGLAFIAFPIAIAQMPGGLFWAILFFFMLLCLGIDSEFAMVESVITVLRDAGIEEVFERNTGCKLAKPLLAVLVCAISYVCGLIFVTRGGIYWFELFDNYACVVTMFFVTFMECFGLMWCDSATWPEFAQRTREWTGRTLGRYFLMSWKYLCPSALFVLILLSFIKLDLMGASKSVPFPQGAGYFPGWSIPLGWAIGLMPVFVFIVMAVKSPGDAKEEGEDCCAASSNTGANPDSGVVSTPANTPAAEPSRGSPGCSPGHSRAENSEVHATA